jgi:hypothetical protein
VPPSVVPANTPEYVTVVVLFVGAAGELELLEQAARAIEGASTASRTIFMILWVMVNSS